MKAMLKTVILLTLIPCAMQAAQVAPAKRAKSSGPNFLTVSKNTVIRQAKIDLTKVAHRSHKKGAKIATLEPLQQPPKVQNLHNAPTLLQVAEQPKLSDHEEKLKKEWAELEASLDFDYEITRNTFRNDNCRMCAHNYINGLYEESEHAQKMLEFYKTISPKSELTMEDLRNDRLQLVIKRCNISELVLHPYYKYLITLTTYAAPLKLNKGSLGLRLCKKHQKMIKKTERRAPVQPTTVNLPNGSAPAPIQEGQLAAPFTIAVDKA